MIVLRSRASWTTSFKIWFHSSILILCYKLILIYIVSKLCDYRCLCKFFHQISLFISHVIPLNWWMLSSIYSLLTYSCIQQIFFKATYFLYLALFDLFCRIQRDLMISNLPLGNFARYIYLIFPWIVEICVALSIN